MEVKVYFARGGDNLKNARDTLDYFTRALRKVEQCVKEMQERFKPEFLEKIRIEVLLFPSPASGKPVNVSLHIEDLSHMYKISTVELEVLREIFKKEIAIGIVEGKLVLSVDL
ncbi:MAG: hypothetical protein J7M14_00570 [Planctomycetes bacterium]|nr:hypothetical protein [Planctomycetota bacterium]